ncbi:hypothetical protein RBSH_03898 [Rhodopirellula baltica SH28]|uniref:Uncharacterized protein n=1 Tax=Rhodopirellula baltica SH28 TaxID=993517 RepID=K5E512_RHOBT|nr:hypothetical protein RBSH_03898 [Rhodopirellula baltica SH28]
MRQGWCIWFLKLECGMKWGVVCSIVLVLDSLGSHGDEAINPASSAEEHQLIQNVFDGLAELEECGWQTNGDFICAAAGELRNNTGDGVPFLPFLSVQGSSLSEASSIDASALVKSHVENGTPNREEWFGVQKRGEQVFKLGRIMRRGPADLLRPKPDGVEASDFLSGTRRLMATFEPIYDILWYPSALRSTRRTGKHSIQNFLALREIESVTRGLGDEIICSWEFADPSKSVRSNVKTFHSERLNWLPTKVEYYHGDQWRDYERVSRLQIRWKEFGDRLFPSRILTEYRPVPYDRESTTNLDVQLHWSFERPEVTQIFSQRPEFVRGAILDHFEIQHQESSPNGLVFPLDWSPPTELLEPFESSAK